MNFGQVLQVLKEGIYDPARVRRAGWNGKGMWLGLQTPDANSKMGLPYVYLSTVDGKLVPWNPNNIDMLAEDWEICE